MLDGPQIAALVAAARQARENAHAPYSGFRVGAAVVAGDERVYLGCNVENASFGLSLCAERGAMAAAVAAGGRPITALVVVSESDPPATPCGACRQWLAELGGESAEVICARPDGRYSRFVLAHLLPEAFTLRP